MRACVLALLLAIGLAVSPAWADEAALTAPRASVEALLLQHGVGNRASVNQAGAAFSSALIFQHGDLNALSLNQTGVGNIAGLGQFGSSNTLDLTQQGGANAAMLAQVGTGLSLAVTQTGGAAIVITQRGR